MKSFFTSDTHYGHANIILYSGRPFLQTGDTFYDETEKREKWTSSMTKRAATRRHDAKLIANSNELVTDKDDIYHCGDFNFGTTANIIEILRKLKFRNFYFVWGNHDQAMSQFKDIIHYYDDLKYRVHFLGDMPEIEIEGQPIILTHYAMRVWNKSHRGVWNLYGHSHGSLSDDPHSLSFDVGVDCHGYYPISFDRVKEIMANKLWKPIDHHGERQEGGGTGLGKADYEKADRKRLYEQLKVEFEKS